MSSGRNSSAKITHFFRDFQQNGFGELNQFDQMGSMNYFDHALPVSTPVPAPSSTRSFLNGTLLAAAETFDSVGAFAVDRELKAAIVPKSAHGMVSLLKGGVHAATALDSPSGLPVERLPMKAKTHTHAHRSTASHSHAVVETKVAPVASHATPRLSAKAPAARELKEMPWRPLPVSSFGFDLAQGVMHGGINAVMSSVILNPIDKFHAAVSIKGWEVHGFAKFFDSPFKGLAYNIKTKIPRDCSVFTIMPIVRDMLQQEGGLSETQSKIWSGIVGGGVESLITSENAARKILGWTASKSDFDQVWMKLTPTQQGEAKYAAFRWGAARGAVYWAMMPIITDKVNDQLKAVIHPESYLANGVDLAIAGMAGSMAATIMSYPLDRVQKGMVVDVRKKSMGDVAPIWKYMAQEGLGNGSKNYVEKHPVFAPWKQCFDRRGLWQCIKTETHRGSSISLLRMGAAGAIWNVALKGAEEALGAVARKKELEQTVVSRRPKGPKA